MKKFSKKLIPYRLIVNIFASILMGVVTFSSFIPEEEVIEPEIFQLAFIMALVAIIVSYALLSVYQFLYYKCSGYELRENEIVCVKGVLFKKKSIVEYKKIHAVNSKQNIIEKMFGISVLQVDSGSTNTAHNAEIQIIEDDNVVSELMRVIKAKQNNEEVQVINESSLDDNKEATNLKEANEIIESVYKFDSKRKAIYSALQVAWILVGGIAALIVGLFAMIVLVVLREMDLPMLLIILAGVLVVFILLSVFSFVVGLIASLIAYYDFKLVRTKNNIEVSYGLFTKIHNTFKYNKIKAIRVTQSIIQKIFGFVTVKVEVIGYTVQTNNENQASSTGMLIPLCKKSELNDILNNLLPNYIPEERQVKSNAYVPFISYHFLFSFASLALVQVMLAIFLVYYSYVEVLLIVSLIMWAIYIVYMSIVLIDRKLAQLNSGYSLTDGKLCIHRGSLVKEIIVMRKQNIIGIDAKTTHFRSKKNIYTYKIHFRTNASTNTVTVLNINKNEGDKMYELIRY